MNPRSSQEKYRVGLLSLGCPKTLVDSEVILGSLDPRRYSIAESVSDCDVALINTCAFIEDAQQESVDRILELVELKKEGQIQKLIVVGCLVQRFSQELQKELGEVDAFVGSGEYDKIPQVVEEVVRGEKLSAIGVPGYLSTSGERRVSLTPSFWRYLKISEGCDHTCSFCVIPSFRGRHRSRSLEDVVREAKTLVSEGARELILTGQDTTFFGYDLGGRYLLPDLLRALNEIDGLRWVRILYAYPSLVSEKLIESIAALEKVCHYLDMPLQHVSDRILRSMRRGTRRASTRRLIAELRQRIPDLAIRSTFIVGYPGETEREFNELLEFMQEACFERLGIFTYSPEEGSLAASLPGQVSERMKEKRLGEAMRLQQEISRGNNRRFLGRTLEILVEEPSEEKGVWLGRSYADAPEVDGAVLIKAPEGERLSAGEFVSVKITETKEYDLVGELSETEPA